MSLFKVQLAAMMALISRDHISHRRNWHHYHSYDLYKVKTYGSFWLNINGANCLDFWEQLENQWLQSKLIKACIYNYTGD